MAVAADILGARGAGLLVTVDEVHRQQIDDLAQLCAELQHRFRDKQVNAGIAAARRRMGSLVHGPTLADTSDVDRSFLLAMSQDDGPSLMSDIAKRLDVDGNYASQYRLRLIEAEIIRPVRRGVVDFALPNLREYLRQHAAAGLDPYGTGSVLPDD